MSILIKVKKSENKEHEGKVMLYETAQIAVSDLYANAVVKNVGAHHATILRRLVKSKAIEMTMIKGAIKSERCNSLESAMSEETMQWLIQNEYAKPAYLVAAAYLKNESQQEEVKEEPAQEVKEEVKEEEAPKQTKAQINAAELAQKFTNDKGDNPFGMLAEMIAPYVKPDYEFAAEQINKLVSDAIRLMKPQRHDVYVNGEFKASTGLTHMAFDKVLRAVSAGTHIWLIGEAGGGKTHLAHQVAESLGLQFYSLSMGLSTGEHHLFGYRSVSTGEYVRQPFRDAYEHGGLFLLDEIDACSAEALTAMNASLANNGVIFPDGVYVERHKDFRCIAAANTFGTGADRRYVGRQQIDAATLDRFVFMTFEYDEELELELASNKNFTRLIQRIRAKVREAKQHFIISPRASINGGKLLSAGFTESEALEMVVYKGCSDEVRNIIKSAL